MRTRILIFLVVLITISGFWNAVSWAEQAPPFGLETIATQPKGVAEGILKALQPQGLRLVGGKSAAVGELWLRSTIPLQVSAAGPGYGSLAEGTLVGVLNFPQGGFDFRGQAIKPGVYTLRYERIPQDGNHMGAAPEMYFLLLCPTATDSELDASFDFNKLVALSRQVSGTNHPAPLMLLPVPDQTELPGVQTNDLGHVAVRAKALGKPAGSGSTRDFPLALVLVGKAEQ